MPTSMFSSSSSSNAILAFGTTARICASVAGVEVTSAALKPPGRVPVEYRAYIVEFSAYSQSIETRGEKLVYVLLRGATPTTGRPLVPIFGVWVSSSSW